MVNNNREIDINQAVDRSKTFLIDSQLCLIDETQSKGNFDEKKKLLNDLKRIITEDVINVRELYKEYREVETCTNYVISQITKTHYLFLRMMSDIGCTFVRELEWTKSFMMTITNG